MTFVFFIYGDIQWGDAANIGFDGGDGTRFFMVPGALKNLNIDEGSNVGVTGLYVYRVDLCSVLGPIDGEKPKLLLLLLVITIRNIFRANSGGQHYLSSQISQNDG